MPVRYHATGNGLLDRLIRPIVDLLNALEQRLVVVERTLTEVAEGGGAGGGNGVEVTVDFGTDGDLATATVVGQTWVTATSTIVAGGFGTTADHDAEDALLEQLQVIVTNRVPGVGFDVLVHAPEGTHGQYRVHCMGV